MADQKSEFAPISVDFHFAACFCSDLNFGKELWREEMANGRGKREDVEKGEKARSRNRAVAPNPPTAFTISKSRSFHFQDKAA